MTPLAQRIARLSCDPKSRHDPDYRVPMQAFYDGDVHCFEITEVMNLIKDMHDGQRKAAGARLAFLPAPKTWIEFDTHKGSRMGVLLLEHGPMAQAFSMKSINTGSGVASIPCDFWIPLCNHPEYITTKPAADYNAAMAAQEKINLSAAEIADISYAVSNTVIGALALINTPRIIGRTSHMPHAGLQRELARAKGMTGKFPLQAWTEIKLEVHAPRVESGDHEIHLSGSKAYHFCRAHLRMRYGQLEFVSAHWRGDPSLGIKQSRYKVVPPHA